MIAAILRRIREAHPTRRGNAPPEMGVKPGHAVPLIVPASVRVAAHADGLGFLEIEKGEVFLCNRTGRRIWQELEAHRSPEEIAAELSREYAIPLRQIGEDMAEFIADLRKWGLLCADGRG